MPTAPLLTVSSGELPFLRSDAVRSGLTDRVLAGPGYRPLFHGVHVVADPPDTVELRAYGALLLAPAGAVLSHHTAAALRDGPVPFDERVHVTVPPGTPLRVVGIVTHLGRPNWSDYRGWPLSTPADNFLELALSLSRTDLVVFGDAMVRRGLATCDGLTSAARTARRRGACPARVAAALVRPRVDSPAETRTRLLTIDAGLPEPVTGYVVRDAVGGWLGQCDLAYPAYRIVIEYDGDLHRTSRRKWRTDVAKRDLLRDHGWTVIVLTADDLDRYPVRTVARIATALRQTGCTDAAVIAYGSSR